MLAKRLHHISFAVSDLDRSRRFYEDVLGLEEIERPDLGIGGIWYRAGDAEVHLIVTPSGIDVGHPAPGLTPLANHNAFAIDDYGEVLEQLKKRDVEVLETNPEVGQMWIRDPDGNVIELIAPRSR